MHKASDGQDDYIMYHPNSNIFEYKGILQLYQDSRHKLDQWAQFYSNFGEEGTKLPDKNEYSKDNAYFFSVFQICFMHGPSMITPYMFKRTTGGLYPKRQETCTLPKWNHQMWATTLAS